MARKKSEHPKALLRRRIGGFDLLDIADEERLMHIAVGAVVEAELWQNRSLSHMRLYWATLHSIVQNSEGQYATSEQLHEVLKIAMGYSHTVKLVVPSKHAVTGTETLKLLRDLRVYLNDLLKRCSEKKKPGPRITEAIHDLGNLVSRIDGAGRLCKELESDLKVIHLPGSIAFDKMDQAAFKVYFDTAIALLDRAGHNATGHIEEAKKKLARIDPPADEPQES